MLQLRKSLQEVESRPGIRTAKPCFLEQGNLHSSLAKGICAYSYPEYFIPNVFILNIGLPEMDRYEVARELRKDPAVKTRTIIALSGYGRKGDIKRCRESGFTRHLLKPLEYDKLLDLLLRG